MTPPPEKDKPKIGDRPVIREPLPDTNGSCLRGILVFIGLLIIFGVILWVMSQL